ncbi:MAG: hypothetical protein GWO24_08245, partial [Akkermansiaceae bacterium]|nr:hypothetical protein [Akkermansiaceae bacterium]
TPSNRVLVERDITLSDLGGFDHSFRLPAETVGYFNIELSWPGEIATAEQSEDWLH